MASHSPDSHVIKSGFMSLRFIFMMNLIALALGCVLGYFWQSLPRGTGPLITTLAWLPVALVKSFAGPLLFFAILNGMMADQSLIGGVKRLFFVCATNALFAVTIALTLVNVFKPGRHMGDLVQGFSRTPPAGGIVTDGAQVSSWTDVSKSFVPDSLVRPFFENNIPALIVLAILIGFGIRAAGFRAGEWDSRFEKLRTFVDLAISVISFILRNILLLMPIAIFAAVGKATGEVGFSALSSLSWYLLITVTGMSLQIALVYQAWVVIKARRTLRQFWSHAKIPVIYAFGVNSSLSSLPATLEALDGLKCSKVSARLGACIGTNFNNDGILLYEVVAVIMLAQAFGIDWSYLHQIGVAFVCVLATLGVSGFPEAGVVALSLVLPAAGLPIEIIPLLLPVDWIVARCRSVTNVVSDMAVSLAIDGPMDTARDGEF